VESEKGFERRENGVRHTDKLLVDWWIWILRLVYTSLIRYNGQ